jgi:hypothetical protein
MEYAPILFIGGYNLYLKINLKYIILFNRGMIVQFFILCFLNIVSRIRIFLVRSTFPIRGFIEKTRFFFSFFSLQPRQFCNRTTCACPH